MEIEKVQCVVKVKQGKDDQARLLAVVKAGPSAIPASEIPILRSINDIATGMSEAECCIGNAKVVGTFMTDKRAEYERLCMKYGQERVDRFFPQGRLMPSTLKECELPDGCVQPAILSSKPAAIEPVVETAPEPEPEPKPDMTVK